MKTVTFILVFVLLSSMTALIQAQSRQTGSASKIVVRVLDKETFKPIDAKIIISGQNPGNQATPLFEDLVYKYKISSRDTTSFFIYAEGYEPFNETIPGDEINGTEIFYLTPKRNIADTPTTNALSKNISESSKPILREEIASVLYFNQSNTMILPRSRKEMDRLLDFLQNHEITRIELEGHTDNVGDPDKNMLLSIDRAGLIRKLLLAKNLDPDKVRSKAFGSMKPAAPNDTERNRRFNRRVELRLATAR